MVPIFISYIDGQIRDETSLAIMFGLDFSPGNRKMRE